MRTFGRRCREARHSRLVLAVARLVDEHGLQAAAAASSFLCAQAAHHLQRPQLQPQLLHLWTFAMPQRCGQMDR